MPYRNNAPSNTAALSDRIVRCAEFSILNCLLTFVLLVGASPARGQASGQKPSDLATTEQNADETRGTHAGYASDLTAQPGWAFPVTELNRRLLPSWIRIGGQYRNRFEGQLGINFTGTNDSYLLSRFRLRVLIKPKSWLMLHGEVQDSRIFFNRYVPNGNPYEDSWTLWVAYPQIGSTTDGWADVLAGRQILTFGDERVIGPSNWLNVGRTFNVARFDFHPPGYKVSVFASSVVPGDNLRLHGALAGNNLYGIYGSIQNKVIPKGNFEPYILWRVAPANPGLSEEVGHGHLNEVTLGVYARGSLPADFDFDSEFDGQQGSLGRYSIDAWAGYVSFGKTFRQAAAVPRTFLEFNYASGTSNPAGHDWNTFDQIYPSNHDKYGFADLIGRRNLVQYRAGIEEVPSKKWEVKQQFEGFWLATANDNLYNANGQVFVAAHPGVSRHVGNEFDIVAEYTLNKGFNVGFGYARMFVGPFLRTTTEGHDYQYPYAYFQYNFTKSAFHYPIDSNQPNYW